MTFIYNTTITTQEEEMTRDDVTGQINGTLQQFTTSDTYKTGTLRVYYNGVYLRSGTDYEEVSSNSFRLLLNTPQSGEFLLLEYIKL